MDFFREWQGRMITEEDFRAWERARYPNAVHEFGTIYNFQSWISKQAAMCGFVLEAGACCLFNLVALRVKAKRTD